MTPARLLVAGAAIALGALGAIAAPACTSGLTDPLPQVALDEAFFRCHVQPILSKECATFACHGNADRAFRLYARNRLRYGNADETQRNSKLNDAERQLNFDAARAFVDVGNRDDSFLLMKPLEADAGGYYHGATKIGTTNVFASTSSMEWQTIAQWVKGAKEPNQQCVEPGSDM